MIIGCPVRKCGGRQTKLTVLRSRLSSPFLRILPGSVTAGAVFRIFQLILSGVLQVVLCGLRALETAICSR